MSLTFDQVCRSGGGDIVYLMHIGGMDWASTSDGRIIKALGLDDVDPATPTTAEIQAITMRGQLFGSGYTSGYYNVGNEVHILKNLDDNLGSQTFDYGEDKGIFCGSWATSMFGSNHGYTWRWSSSIVCRGIMGMDVSPVLSTPGVVSAVLSRDAIFAKSGAGGWKTDIYWSIDTDEGLKTFIDTQRATGRCFLWLGNSCLYVDGSSVSTSGDEYYVSCYNQCWNTPNEYIFRDNINGLENLRITNVPQRLNGATAKLFAIPWTVEMQAQYEAMI